MPEPSTFVLFDGALVLVTPIRRRRPGEARS
jgi:hypothetical protein